MSEFNTEDLDEVIASTNGSLAQMLALQLKNELAKNTALTSQLESVVAENASVKVMNDCLSEELRSYESDGAFEGPKMHLLWWKVETPATDAFLAEVGASGLEMAANMLNRNHPLMSEAADAIISHAAQLRQEAK